MKPRGLGRGLDALLGGAETMESERREILKDLPVDVLVKGKYQPRTHMDEEALRHLADSITARGVIQPIVVRPIDSQRYEIIAGERRWRACQMAGLETIPALVREVEDADALAMALVENIQREELNAIEEAQAMERLLDEFELTHENLASALGRSRAAVSNLLRLLRLPTKVRASLEAGKMSAGHARALLNLAEEQQILLADEVVRKGLSVRELERRVQKMQKGNERSQPRRDPDIIVLEERMSADLGVKVSITQRGEKGKISLEFSSPDQREALLKLLQAKH